MATRHHVQRWQAIAVAGIFTVTFAAVVPFPWRTSAGQARKQSADRTLERLVAATPGAIPEIARELRDLMDGWRILREPDQADAVKHLIRRISELTPTAAAEAAVRLKAPVRDCLLWPLAEPAGSEVRLLAATSLRALAAKSR